MERTHKIDQRVQELILQRVNIRNQNALEKLKNDTNIIKNRKKCDSPEPFRTGVFHRLSSHHVWEDILGYLTDIWDINSAYFACSGFEKILRERRNSILFTNREVLNMRDKDDSVGGGFKLEINSLEVRGVSKSWKKAWDSRFFEFPFLNDSWYLDEGYEADWNNAYKYNQLLFNSTASVTLALKSCPILPRIIVVNECGLSEENLEIFRERILQFFEFYGDNVWLFRYTREFDTLANAYERLWNIVSKMPNLKRLDILNSPSFHETNSEQLSQLKERLEQCPFPMLENLKVLEIHWEQECVITQIYENCQNLKSVACRPFHPRSEGALTAQGRLQLERCWERWDWDATSFPVLSSMSTTWPLRTLELEHDDYKDFVKDSLLWPILNKFGQTLEKLRLNFPIVKDANIKENEKIKLDLPNLKYLKLSAGFWNSRLVFVDFDDFILLSRLEEMHFCALQSENFKQPDRKKIVEVEGFLWEMQNFNLWKIFPNLGKLKLEFCATDRAQDLWYERQGSIVILHEEVRKTTIFCGELLVLNKLLGAVPTQINYVWALEPTDTDSFFVRRRNKKCILM